MFFQFCKTLINFDLCWNPNALCLEQPSAAQSHRPHQLVRFGLLEVIRIVDRPGSQGCRSNASDHARTGLGLEVVDLWDDQIAGLGFTDDQPGQQMFAAFLGDGGDPQQFGLPQRSQGVDLR